MHDMSHQGHPVSVERYRGDDRRAVHQLYRRVFGDDAAGSSRLRWEWQYSRNPNLPADGPMIWVVREGPTIIGHYGTMPVRLRVAGEEVNGSWGMDVMVAPERQRKGVGEVLLRTWERNVGAALGLGPSEASMHLFRKLGWHEAGPVPCVVKPLTRRALRRAQWPMPLNRLVSALTLPVVRVIARARPLKAHIEPVRPFDGSFTELWERVKGDFDLAVRRDASYLNWKYLEPPHVRYATVALRREGRTDGYAVYRHVQEPLGRVTLLVDFLAHPDDEEGLQTLLGWVDREARRADSDKVRCYVMHDGFRKTLRRFGYFNVRADMLFTLKINEPAVGRDFYERRARWHVTLGDSDLDR
jgi:GNAT superfamily N-acetyltransferase